MRTALHLAAAEGHATIVEFLIKHAPVEQRQELLSPRDRWGATPLNEAIHNKNTSCISILKKHGATEGLDGHLNSGNRSAMIEEDNIDNH